MNHIALYSFDALDWIFFKCFIIMIIVIVNVIAITICIGIVIIIVLFFLFVCMELRKCKLDADW